MFFFDIYLTYRDKYHLISKKSYLIFRKLDEITAGISTKLIEICLRKKTLSRFKKISEIEKKGGIFLGNFSGQHIKELKNLKLISPDGNILLNEGMDKFFFESPRINIDKVEILKNKEITNFIINSEFSEIAEAYLHSKVICTNIHAWWSFPIKENIDLYDRSAQMYHRDIDWIRDFKIFIFATDVNKENGPFEYIQGTHKRDLTRLSFADRRVGEKEIADAYPEREIIQAICKAGDVFAFDTRGFHRGAPLASGKRCVMSIDFTINRFGCEYQYQKRPKLQNNWESFELWSKVLTVGGIWNGLFSE